METPEALEAPEAQEALEGLEAPEAQEAQEALEAQEAPETPEAQSLVTKIFITLPQCGNLPIRNSTVRFRSTISSSKTRKPYVL